MRLCAVTKYPPIQGGVSARCFWLSRILAERGHQVLVVTNANEVEDDYRIWIPPEDLDRLEGDFASGGSVRVVNSGRFDRGLFHIPYANPYVTKLASLATEEIRRNDSEVIFSYYFEPYGLSAQLAASWTGLPHVVQHAGSDRTRLMDHPELSVSYKEMLRRASLVVTGSLDLEGLGIPVDRLVRLQSGFLPSEFNLEGPVYDFDLLVGRLSELGSPWITNRRSLDRDAATIGVYGKAGEVKGLYDLIAALARLRDRGLRFNLVTLVGGRERTDFVAALHEAKLADRTWTLPFLPHWRVPEFIRACTAVCFLERRFPIEIHAPGIPRESMACGICAVLSEEVARKQPFWPELRHGENALLVKDPADIDALATVLEHILEDPSAARDIGRAGAALVQPMSSEALGEAYEAVLQRALASQRSSSAIGTTVGLSSEEKDNRERDTMAFLRRHMPASLRALEGQAQGWLRAFLEGQELTNLDTASRALAFADALIARVTQRQWRPDSDGAIAEVIRFERDRLWLAVDVESLRGLPAFPRVKAMHRANRHDRQFDRLRPVRSNWVRISDFAIDVEAAVRTLREGGVVSKTTQAGGLHVFLFQKRGSLKGRVFRINQATKTLIALCDGTRTVAEIVDVSANECRTTRKWLHDYLRRLAEEQVISLR